ncbi:MAG: PilZ domain-containing protein [Deltaproteobacteria bacterium]|nr:PilZ domain-containing protein [Deltaproteobacteria bacterium]
MDSLKQGVVLVGDDRATRRIEVLLSMYSTIKVIRVADINDWQPPPADGLRIACFVAGSKNKAEVNRILAVAESVPGTPTVVFLVAKPSQKVAAALRDAKDEGAVYGRHRLAIRSVEVVIESIGLRLRVPVTSVFHGQCRLSVGDFEDPVDVHDVDMHGALIVAPSDLLEQGKPGTLTLSSSDRLFALPCSVECWEALDDGIGRAFVRFLEVEKPVLDEFEMLIYRAAEELVSKHRPRQRRGPTRRIPRYPVAFKVQVVVRPVEGKSKYYYRLENIGRRGAALSSPGDFDPKLNQGDQVEVTLSWKQHRATMTAEVAWVRRPSGAMSGALREQRLGLSFPDLPPVLQDLLELCRESA